MEEQRQATSWIVELLKDNWFWIGPIVAGLIWGIFDIIFHKLPGEYQGKLKKFYDLVKAKLNKE